MATKDGKIIFIFSENTVSRGKEIYSFISVIKQQMII